jgi:hypothetical protein
MDTTPLPQGPAAAPDDANARFLTPLEQRRRNWIAIGIMLLVLLSAIAAAAVLHDMSAATAAVTGGCGGG